MSVKRRSVWQVLGLLHSPSVIGDTFESIGGGRLAVSGFAGSAGQFRTILEEACTWTAELRTSNALSSWVTIGKSIITRSAVNDAIRHRVGRADHCESTRFTVRGARHTFSCIIEESEVRMAVGALDDGKRSASRRCSHWVLASWTMRRTELTNSESCEFWVIAGGSDA